MCVFGNKGFFRAGGDVSTWVRVSKEGQEILHQVLSCLPTKLTVEFLVWLIVVDLDPVKEAESIKSPYMYQHAVLQEAGRSIQLGPLNNDFTMCSYLPFNTQFPLSNLAARNLEQI
jgi:hypothetical protein